MGWTRARLTSSGSTSIKWTPQDGTVALVNGELCVFACGRWIQIAPESAVHVGPPSWNVEATVEYPAGAPVPSWWDLSVSPSTNEFCDGMVIAAAIGLAFAAGRFYQWVKDQREM